MLGKTKGKELIEYLSDYVIFDLETTGISCYRDKVVEISGVNPVFLFRRLTDIIYASI